MLDIDQGKAIKMGSVNTCIVLENSELKCWGNNSTGQLGNGETTNLYTPTTIDIDVSIQNIVLSIRHTCTIASDGSPLCWGSNDSGELGNGTTIDSLTPVNVTLPTGKKATALALGTTHSCAILDDNSLVCWGDNTYGQIGDGTTQEKNTPVAVNLGDGRFAKAIAAGQNHTCAILDDDSLKCWGDNQYGQLGDKSLVNRHTPTLIDLGEERSAKKIHTRTEHTCTILDNDSLVCWGKNDDGQLGNGNTSNTPIPTPVDFGSAKVQQVAVGGSFSCALVGNYSLMCWGGNRFGQLGNGTNNSSSSPTSVSFLPGKKILSLQAGGFHSCALTEDGELLCWGWNPWGQLGLGDPSTIPDRTIPTAVALNPTP